MRTTAAQDVETSFPAVLFDGRSSRLLSDYTPAHLVVDAASGVLMTFDGPPGLFLAPSAAIASLDLFQLLRDDLHGPVRAAISEAAIDQQDSCRHVLTRNETGIATELVIAVEAVTSAGTLPGGPQRTLAIRYFVIGLFPRPATRQAWPSTDPSLSRRAHEAEARAQALQAVVEKLRERNLDLIARNEQLVQQNETSATLLDSTLIATVFLDRDLRIRDFTRVTTDIFAFRDADIGRPILDLVCRLDYPELACDLKQVLLTRQQLERELHGRDPPDERVFLMCMRPRTRAEDEPGGLVLTFVDITTRKRRENQAWFQAHHDQLTGLPNRARFLGALDEIAERLPGPRGWLGLMYLDLDRFKTANDTFGHAVGDLLLQGVAARLCATVPADALVYRLGGDEFAILLLHDVGLPGYLEALADRLLSEISTSYPIEGHVVQIGASLGVTCQPFAGLDRVALMRAADLALYQAKADGRGVARMFELQLEEAWQRKRDIERDLGDAHLVGQMSMDYQPIVRIADGCIIGAEALVRWHHPDHGRLSPAQFIPVAEESGQIVALGLWALETACADAVDWDVAVGLSVNLSSVQFASLDLVDKVLGVLDRTGLDPARLTLEVTESVLLQDDDRTRDVLSALRCAGVSIAVDDFGTGYASLGYLRDFAFEKIKIDRTFITTIDSQDASAVIVEAIGGIGRGLGIEICAEGVETEAQLLELRRLGIGTAQGFLLHRPMSSAELNRRLVDRSGVAAGRSMEPIEPAAATASHGIG